MKEILAQLAANGLNVKASTVRGVAQKLGASLVGTWGPIAIVDYFLTNKDQYND